MKLDKDYFNSLVLIPARNNFYSRADVDNVLVEIRAAAQEMLNENETLRAQVEEMKRAAAELQTQSLLWQEQLRTAEEQLKKSAQEQDRMERLMNEREDNLVRKVAEAVAEVKTRNRGSVADIDARWQQFLAGLTEEKAPEDLNDKIRAIAMEMQTISGGMHSATAMESNSELPVKPKRKNTRR